MGANRQHQPIDQPHGLTDYVEMTIGNGVKGARKERNARHKRGLTRTARNRKAAWRVPYTCVRGGRALNKSRASWNAFHALDRPACAFSQRVIDASAPLRSAWLHDCCSI